MTALSDIQKALNTIRRITRAEEEAVRLAALALLAAVTGDEAREIAKGRKTNVKANKPPAMPIPRQSKPAVRPELRPQVTQTPNPPKVQDKTARQAQMPVAPQ